MAALIVRRFAWLLGLIVALAGAYLLYTGGRANVAQVKVIETSQSVTAGAVLNSSNLKWAAVPEDAVNPQAVQSASQVVGKVIMVPLPAGQQVLPMWLSTANLTLDRNHIDIPLTVTVATSAVGTLQTGEKVALLWLPSGLTNQAPVVEYLNRPLVVIAVRDAHGNVEGRPTNTPGVSAGVPAIVDLRVTPTDAVKLESQEQSGKLIVLGINQGGEVH